MPATVTALIGEVTLGLSRVSVMVASFLRCHLIETKPGNPMFSFVRAALQSSPHFRDRAVMPAAVTALIGGCNPVII